MESDLNKRSENNSEGDINDGGLSQMPSYEDFDKVRKQGSLPEGIRDEQDYREYIEEQNARMAEKERVDRRIAAEKSEKIGNFEKRLEMNKKLYDDIAYQRALELAAAGDCYEDYHRPGIMEQNYLLENLYNSVVDDDIDNSSVVRWRYRPMEGEVVDTGEIVLPKDGENIYIFKRAFSDFAFNSLMSPAPDSEAIYERAKEMMDTSKYEKDFEKFLNTSSEKISSYYIDSIEEEIHHLKVCSNLFNFEHDGGYQSFTLKGDTAIIPTLESRIRLEDQIVLVRERIASVITEVKARELKVDLNESIQGRRVSSRLKIDLF